MKRYFIIVYVFALINGSTGTGQVDIYTNSGYPNKIKLEESITTGYEAKSGVKVENVVITNIIELTKEEYEQWTEENN